MISAAQITHLHPMGRARASGSLRFRNLVIQVSATQCVVTRIHLTTPATSCFRLRPHSADIVVRLCLQGTRLAVITLYR